MKKVGNWFAASWIGLLLSVLVIGGLAGLLLFDIGGMLPNLSKNEVAQASSSSSVQNLIKNPLGLPHKLPQLAVQQLRPSPAAIRSVSALIGLLTIGSFYYVLKNWYTKRIAILGTLLFATSAWFLHSARTGTDTSVYLLLFVAIACVSWLQQTKGSIVSVLASAVLVIALLYIPGMIWIVLPVVLWQISRVGDILEGQNAGLLTLLSLVILATLAPIGWAMYLDHDLIKTYFGLPQAFPEPIQIVKNIANVPVQLFIRGPNNPETWLGRIPLLSLFSSVMFIIGLYAYFLMRRLDRTWFIAYVLVVGTVLVGLGGPVDLTIILPFIYLIAVGGIAFMLQQWFMVFPRNPFARATGTLLMTAAILLASFNGISHYFIAWPNTPATKQVFIHRR